MRNHPRPVLLFLPLLVAIVTTLILPSAGTNPSVTNPQKRQSSDDQLPLVDYKDLTDPNGNQSKFRRNIREEKDAVEITEAESRIERLPAIPYAHSDAVVIGTPVDAHAYLTADNREVYTQYTVVIEQVLKSQGSFVANVGTTVTVRREGGRVRFPSGRIQTYRLSGQGVPRVGRRHLIFIKQSNQIPNLVLTAFELHDDRVLPIDDLESQTRYKNLRETEFLRVVREAITSSR